MKLFLTLRDSKNQFPNYTLKFRILENQLSKSWLDLLLHNFFEIDHPIEKDNSLKGWVSDWDSSAPRNLDFLCDSINNCIDKINSTMVPLGYEFIDLKFKKEILKGSEYRNLMNSIHHHFEILIGQTWNPSKWFLMADDNTKNAIRLINNLCHEIEASVDSIKLHTQFPNLSNQYIFGSLMGMGFDGKYIEGKIRKDLTIDELNCFSDYTQWGDVTIYYAQLGKRHIEAFRDNDDKIDKTNISGYKYLTGEFVISFPMMTDHQIKNPPEFFNWLDENEFDRTDPRLALGFPRVAELDNKEIKIEIIQNLKNLDDIYQIGVEDDFGNVIKLKTYDFFWTDLNQIERV